MSVQNSTQNFDSSLARVAYFCMEYGLDDRLKTYAGGLGILAGDYLKGAHQKYPIIGIGIKWKQGYTRQMIDNSGQAFDAYHNYQYDFLEDTGVEVSVTIRQREVRCKVWKTQTFDNAELYLLDTDLPDNPDAWITGQLYGWFGEERIAQEMVLGIGGVRALRKLGIEVDVYHFNEGHALFAGFELLREAMDSGLSFAEALGRSRQQIVFTTHTPVVQGNESHPVERIMYMGAHMGMNREQLVSLGGDPFNMTVGALRLSRISNAVAQLHGKTAKQMWKHIDRRSEILAITNGIHKPTWVDSRMLEAANNYPERLWEIHQDNKKQLIQFIKDRTGQELAEDKLLLGFSRRAVPYKRADLIFSKPEIIEPLLSSQKVQIIFSGKSHPLDDRGKQIVARLVEMGKKFPQSVVFVPDYDMATGRMLTRGSDVWLNNPRRPKEASGTSGMKAAMNGVLNMSILDGWWPEACEHGVNGWQFGNAFENEEEGIQDAHDEKALYEVLLEEVIPTYYDNQDRWVNMMKASILSTQDAFSVERMLDEYYRLMYNPEL